MKLDSSMSALVTGGASGLGFASAQQLAARGVRVVIADVNPETGEKAAAALGDGARFVRADVCDPQQMAAAIESANAMAPLRALMHCAGIGGPLRLVEKSGEPGSLEKFEAIVRVNLVGTFNSLRLAAASMVRNESVDGERGACVLTASVAAFEGQIGQIPYASSKAGIVGMTIVAARDLAAKQVRVCTIAPGVFDTPILAKLPQTVLDSLAAGIPHPSRLGRPPEFAMTALHILENPMLNGETIRLDGAIRMAPR
ncbi:SDR family NAD(P)-dependent oxidoreductase [Ramlibacter sp.]|uniref:SDR family NAD(P)-dependent oxidoreductase n=1 Tax=Ramlibacter sp. TaxID=1917967 RepID=UPI003D095EB8